MQLLLLQRFSFGPLVMREGSLSILNPVQYPSIQHPSFDIGIRSSSPVLSNWSPCPPDSSNCQLANLLPIPPAAIPLLFLLSSIRTITPLAAIATTTKEKKNNTEWDPVSAPASSTLGRLATFLQLSSGFVSDAATCNLFWIPGAKTGAAGGMVI